MAGEKTEEQGLTTADALLFAAAAGVAVGNLYWTQPLQPLFRRRLLAISTGLYWMAT